MSNKIIGIKQADGSFYPILQDGKAQSKMLELTTVRDGQTTVQINLYKKALDSSDEPEYVDTLLIENLIPHPKQEPTINLNINLDEDNVLTAQVVDQETGKSSDIRVSMVTLSEAQLAEVPDFTVTDSIPAFEDATPEDAVMLEELSEETAQDTDNADTIDIIEELDDGESADDAETIDIVEEAEDITSAEKHEDADFEGPLSFDIPDFEEPAAQPEQTLQDVQEFSLDETLADEQPLTILDEEGEADNFDADELLRIDDPVQTEALPDFDEEMHEESASADTFNEELAGMQTDFNETENADGGALAEPLQSDFDLGDFEMPDLEKETFDDTADDNRDKTLETDFGNTFETETAEENLSEPPTSFDMPDLEDDVFSAATEELSLNDEAPVSEDDFLPPAVDDFNTARFDDTEQSSRDEPASSDDFSDSAMSFDVPDFEDNSAATQSENTEARMFREKTETSIKENPPLYDLDLPDEIDESGGKKKCRFAAVICIICAILCILAVIGIFLLFPWKKADIAENTNVVTVEPPSQMHMQPPPEEPAKPEENTIVIVEKETVEKREVIPEKTETPAEAKPQTVRYLIKWGDTLWDLSDTYYRNPWLYPIIARENKIKNPDLIIAGTYINIPPR